PNLKPAQRSQQLHQEVRCAHSADSKKDSENYLFNHGSPPSILFSFAFDCRRGRVLALDPLVACFSYAAYALSALPAPVSRLCAMKFLGLILNGLQPAPHPPDYANHDASDKPQQRDWPQENTPQDGRSGSFLPAKREPGQPATCIQQLPSTNLSSVFPKRRPGRSVLCTANECRSSDSIQC